MIYAVDQYGFRRFESEEEAGIYLLLRDFPDFAGDVVITNNGFRIITTAKTPKDLVRPKKWPSSIRFGPFNDTTSTTWPQ